MATKTFGGITYSNGKVPSALLAELEPKGKHGLSNSARAYLRRDAAASWNRAVAEVKAKTGIVLTVRGWNRSLADQEKYFYQRYTTTRLFDRPRKWWNGRYWYLKPGYAAAAAPGYSNHGWALAVDIEDFGAVGQWNHPRYLKAWPILKKHGWTETEGRGSIQEPWHKVYDPSKDQGKPVAKPVPLTLADRKEWQRHLGVTPDGDFGPVTYKAIQSSINSANRRGKFLLDGPLVVDGDFGPRSKTALVKYLNWLNKQWKYLDGGPLDAIKDRASSRRNVAIRKALAKGDLIRRNY